MDTPETAPAASATESTATGSTELDSMLDAAKSPAAPEPKPNYLLSPELFAKQAAELGELRAFKRQQEEASRAASVSATPVGNEFDWSNPDASLKRWEANMRESMRDELRREFEPQIAPLRNQNMAQSIVADSPLAATLLSNPDVVNYLQSIPNNPDLAAQYEDLASVRFRAALFDQASARAKARIAGTAAIKANRPENGGATSPSVPSTAATPPAPPAPPKDMDEGWKTFTSLAAALPGSRSI